MRPNHMRSSAEERPRILVLGSGCLARRIADDLSGLGYQVRFTGSVGLVGQTPEAVKRALQDELAQMNAAPGRVWVHPGVSEWGWRPELSTWAQESRAGIVGPSARLVNLFSNRLSLFSQAEALGIPHPALGLEPVQSEREVERRLGGNGFPVVLKSVSVHGEDQGIRVVASPEELRRELSIWQEQLERSGSGALLLIEKYIEGARALTVPFARFKDGSLTRLPIVDSSLMTRQRRMIEFCPAEKVDPKSEAKIWEAVEALGNATQYVGVGSLEFLVDGSRIWFVGANPTIGTQYPLWEKVGQLSAVQLQMATLLEEAAPPQDLSPGVRSHLWSSGLLVRIHAEDPILRIPQPGRIIERLPERLSADGASQVRATAFSEARIDFCDSETSISSESDGLVALVWAGAKTRKQAVEYMKTVLSSLWIAGGLQTNLRLHQEILEHPWVREGVFHAGFLDEDFVPQLEPPLPVLALFQKFARFVRAESRGDSRGGTDSDIWTCGFKRVSEDGEIALKWASPPRTWRELSGARGYVGRVLEASSDPQGWPVCVCPVGAGVWRVHIGPFSRLIRKTESLERPQGSRRGPEDRLRPFYSQMAGRVHALLYREGREVPAGEPLVVMESLRQLVPLALPGKFRIQSWTVKPGDVVAFGQKLATVEIETD